MQNIISAKRRQKRHLHERRQGTDSSEILESIRKCLNEGKRRIKYGIADENKKRFFKI